LCQGSKTEGKVARGRLIRRQSIRSSLGNRSSFRTISVSEKQKSMTITVQVPDALLQDLATSPDELDREIRLTAAIHLYSSGLISQGKGAEIAGLSRWGFIQALGRAQVPACQVTSEGLKEEVERAYQANRQRVAAHPPEHVRDNVIADALKQAGE
jgi:predicted HTH domain antitoxin